MQELHILHLGAGVQSTALYLLETEDGLVDEAGVTRKFSAAIFADTGDEEQETYQHLAWLESLGGAPIVRVKKEGSRGLGNDLARGIVTASGTRFASIPAFTLSPAGVGITRRQCTREYKIEPVERHVRRVMLGLKPGQRLPMAAKIVSYFGFSTDEPGRAVRTRGRFETQQWQADFPLMWESLWMSRSDCEAYLRDRVPHEVVGSACVFCPFKSNRMWRRLKEKEDQTDWRRAVEIDESLRLHDSVCTTGMDWPMYLHRSCRPLPEVDLGERQLELFDQDCEGGCGL